MVNNVFGLDLDRMLFHCAGPGCEHWRDGDDDTCPYMLIRVFGNRDWLFALADAYCVRDDIVTFPDPEALV